MDWPGSDPGSWLCTYYGVEYLIAKLPGYHRTITFYIHYTACSSRLWVSSRFCKPLVSCFSSSLFRTARQCHPVLSAFRERQTAVGEIFCSKINIFRERIQLLSETIASPIWSSDLHSSSTLFNQESKTTWTLKIGPHGNCLCSYSLPTKRAKLLGSSFRSWFAIWILCGFASYISSKFYFQVNSWTLNLYRY